MSSGPCVFFSSSIMSTVRNARAGDSRRSRETDVRETDSFVGSHESAANHRDPLPRLGVAVIDPRHHTGHRLDNPVVIRKLRVLRDLVDGPRREVLD